VTGARRIAPLDGEWQREAECRDKEPDLFFLAEDERYKPGRFDEAMETCARCPVSGRCDDYAVRSKQRWGIWARQDRGEQKHAQRVANEEAKALQDAGTPADAR